MPKLLLDGMLGRLAKWCRLLGIDTDFSTSLSDCDMMAKAKMEARVLVTMDRELVLRCEKAGISCISVVGKKTEEQVAQVIRELKYEPDFPNNKRCPSCNGELAPMGKERKGATIPQDVTYGNGSLSVCSSCAKPYWEGSQWRNIVSFYKRIETLLSEND